MKNIIYHFSKLLSNVLGKFTILDNKQDQLSFTFLPGDEDSYTVLRPGSPIYVTSPDFPNSYPPNITRTLQFRVQNGTRAHIVFESFSLEPVFDTLTVGRGPDPTNQSTVVFEFSEELNGQRISGFIPEREFWFVFKSDWDSLERRDSELWS